MARLDWHRATIEYCQSWTSLTRGEFGAEAITTLWLRHAGIQVVFTFWAPFQYKCRVSSCRDSHYLYGRDHQTNRTTSLYKIDSLLGPRPVYSGKQGHYHRYHQISDMRRAKSPNLNVSRLILQLSLPNQLKPILSREWRCSWSSADRWCSNYIWVINNFIPTCIRGLTVHHFG